MLITTFQLATLPSTCLMQRHRTRWQVELAFKCFKSPAQFENLRKHAGESTATQLCGKLRTEKLLAQPRSITPRDTLGVLLDRSDRGAHCRSRCTGSSKGSDPLRNWTTSSMSSRASPRTAATQPLTVSVSAHQTSRTGGSEAEQHHNHETKSEALSEHYSLRTAGTEKR